MEHLLTELGGQGALGLVAAIALYIAWKKDRQVEALHAEAAKTAETNEAKKEILHDRLTEQASVTADKYHALASELQETLKDLHSSLEEEA